MIFTKGFSSVWSIKENSPRKGCFKLKSERWVGISLVCACVYFGGWLWESGREYSKQKEELVQEKMVQEKL